MRNFIKHTIVIFGTLLFTTTAFALPLDSMPERVGGYVRDDLGQPISGATVTFINQATLDEYTGLSDATGWYGNVGFSSVPDASVKSLLSQNYPNPFTSSTTVEIASRSLEKNFGSEPQDIQIYDVRGRLVGSVPALNGTHDIQTRRNASLPKSAYFYKLGNEVRKMVGSPKRITVVVSGSGDAGKALVQYRRTVEADGYVIQDELVDLDGQNINFASVNLVPTATGTSLAINVFNISGSECLLDGSVTVSGDTYSQTESAGSDSLFSFTIPTSVAEVQFSVSGFLGYDHPNQVFSVLNPDSVAVRGWLGDEESVTAVGDLPELVYLELVPELRLDDPLFLESAAQNGIVHRQEDVRILLYVNTYESEFVDPVIPIVLDRLRFGVNTLVAEYDGGVVDGVPLINYSVTEISAPDGSSPMGRHDVWINNDVGPGNYPQDRDGDGDVDYARSSIRESDGPGELMDELLGPIVLYDVAPYDIPNAYDGDGNILPNGIDLIHTVMKSRIGRNLNSVTPRTQEVAVRVFNISGSECLVDGQVQVTGDGYFRLESVDSDSLYRFSVPASLPEVEFSVRYFSGYNHTNQVFSILHPDSVAVRGWLGDDETPTALGDLPPVVYLELVPEVRLDDPLFLESVAKNSVAHSILDKRFVLRLNTEVSGYTVPANEVTLNKLRTTRDNYFQIIDGGGYDGIPLIGYTSHETSDAPIQTPQEMTGRHDLYVNNSVGPGNTRLILDYAVVYSASHMRDLDGQGDAFQEVTGPTVLFDNDINSTISGLIELDEVGGLVYSAKGIDMIHTVMKSRLGRNFGLLK